MLIFGLISVFAMSPSSKNSTELLEQSDNPIVEIPSPIPSVSPSVAAVVGQQYRVTKVVDGDTITVQINGSAETIRLLGVNTPETVDPRKKVQCFGKEASDYTKISLAGKMVSLEADRTQGDRDRYGRLLRYVYTENGDLFNKTLISQGFAYEYTYDKPYAYQVDFKGAQKEAMTQARGLWSSSTCGGTL